MDLISKRKKVGKVQRKQMKSVNSSADKEVGKGKHGKKNLSFFFFYFQCLIYVADAK
jgi:hypothetical protein